EVLLCFDPVLTQQTGPYTVRCKSWFSDFLKPLRDIGADELGLFLTRAEAAAPVIEIILSYPGALGEIRVTESSCDHETIPAGELEAYAGLAPQGFRTIGWRARNVPGLRLTVVRGP